MPTFQDIKLIARLFVYGLMVGIVPSHRWRRASDVLFRLRSERKQKRMLEGAAETVDRLEQALGSTAPAARRERLEEVLFLRAEDTLSVLREYWPGGWNPSLQVRGAERLSRALEEGKGAILWVPLQNNRLAWKMALHDAGIRVAHLSRPEHGFSKTAFSIRYINPVCTRIEGRYVERVVIPPGGEVAAIRRLREKLSRNEVVSIQDSGGGRTVAVQFLGGHRSFYVGAPSIALSSGAALLPLFPVRERDDAFAADIGPAIHMPRGVARAGAIEAMTREFARQLAPYVTGHPECWTWERWSASGKTEEA